MNPTALLRDKDSDEHDHRHGAADQPPGPALVAVERFARAEAEVAGHQIQTVDTRLQLPVLDHGLRGSTIMRLCRLDRMIAVGADN